MERGKLEIKEAKNSKYWVIVPTYNEKDNIADIVEKILSQPLDITILIVDDNSPDGTGVIADSLSEADARVKVLHRKRKEGLGTAYIAGFKYAMRNGADFMFEIDADFSHNPDDIIKLGEAVQNADLVVGSRYIKGGGTENWKMSRWLISRGGNLYTKIMARTDTTDTTSGFRCYRRKVLEAIDLDKIDARGYAFQIEMTFVTEKLGFKVIEIPITFTDRMDGKSKMSFNIFFEGLVVVAGLRRKYRNLKSL